MSWQTYVDDHLLCEIEGNHLISAAIIGQDGTVWAQSANFPQVSFLCPLPILLDFTWLPFFFCSYSDSSGSDFSYLGILLNYCIFGGLE